MSINPWRILWKTCLILLIINFAFPLLNAVDLPAVSLYNSIFPGRLRLPFGENPELSYNLTLNDIDSMFASHIVSKASEEEYSIFLIGDSSIWGTLLKNDETIAAKLQEMIDTDTDRGQQVRVYNLGYPTSSVLKDLVLLDKAMQYKPDMVIWFVTLNSLVKDSYLEAPIILNNAEKTNAVISKYDLNMELLEEPAYWDQTFYIQRRNIYDRIHLQILASMWASTGIDQYIPDEYAQAARDLEADDSYQYIVGHFITENDLDLAFLEKFIEKNPGTEIVVINEPILISSGLNSDIRYDLYYPRDTYDEYRNILSTQFNEMEIKYIDLWNVVPEGLFTNSAIHYNVQGVGMVAEKIYSMLMKGFTELK